MVPVLLAQWPSSLVRFVPLLLAYVLMPPDRVAIGGLGGSRVRETKKALLGRSRSLSAASRLPFAATGSSGCSTVVPIVVKGTVSKITEKFQAQPPPPPVRTITRIPKPLHASDRGARPQPPPLPPLPPPIVKYEIKRRQEKLLGELHRRRGSVGDRMTTTASFPVELPVVVGGGGVGGGDSAVSSDCGSSSDSEKSVCCGGRSVDNKPEDKPGSPHSSGYESVEETMPVSATVVPYSWVFGAPEPSGGFDEVVQMPAPPLSTSSLSSSSSSSDGCCEGDDDDDDDVPTAPPEDRHERLVTFASAASCPALTCAKPDQDGDEDVPAAIIRRHFGGGNDGPKPIAAMAGYLSPIPEGSSTEPNSVETVEDCCGYDDDKVGTCDWPVKIKYEI